MSRYCSLGRIRVLAGFIAHEFNFTHVVCVHDTHVLVLSAYAVVRGRNPAIKNESHHVECGQSIKVFENERPSRATDGGCVRGGCARGGSGRRCVRARAASVGRGARARVSCSERVAGGRRAVGVGGRVSARGRVRCGGVCGGR